MAQPPTPHTYEPLSAKQEGADESGNPQWSTLPGRQEVAIDSAEAKEAGVAEAGTSSSSSVETSASQRGLSACATSTPAEAVLAVSEGVSRIPAVEVLSLAGGVAPAAGLAVCGQHRLPCGRSRVDCSDWR